MPSVVPSSRIEDDRLNSASGFLALALMVLCGTTALGQAQRFIEINGEIETTSHRPGEPTDIADVVRRVFAFKCIAGTNEWRIDNDFVQGGEEKWFYDGTNVCNSIRVMKAPPQAITDMVAKQVGVAPFQVAHSNLTVYIRESPDGHPLGNAGVNIPWLAFCSGNYLKRAGRIVPLPVATLRHAPNGFAYSDRTETFDDELGLPRVLTLFSSRSMYVLVQRECPFCG
jgi:hypothetical protein